MVGRRVQEPKAFEQQIAVRTGPILLSRSSREIELIRESCRPPYIIHDAAVGEPRLLHNPRLDPPRGCSSNEPTVFRTHRANGNTPARAHANPLCSSLTREPRSFARPRPCPSRMPPCPRLKRRIRWRARGDRENWVCRINVGITSLRRKGNLRLSRIAGFFAEGCAN